MVTSMESQTTEFAVSRCSAADRSELRAFQMTMHGSTSRVHDPIRRAWLFDQHPYRSEEGPSVWICRHDGAIVGTWASVPFAAKIGNERSMSSWGIDAMVAPSWRGTGVAKALWEARRAGLRFSAAVSVSDAAYRSCLRWGYKDMGAVPRYLFVLKARGYDGLGRASRSVLRWGRPLGPALVWCTDQWSTLRASRTEVTEIDRFDDEVDRLWRTASPAYPVVSVRDRAWLKWRFDDHPSSTDYRRYYVAQSGRMIGYFVVRAMTLSDAPALEVVDYFAAPGDLVALFGGAVKVARQSDAIALQCSTTARGARPALLSLGFWRRKHGPRFIVHADDDDPVRSVILDPASWFLTTADSDID